MQDLSQLILRPIPAPVFLAGGSRSGGASAENLPGFHKALRIFCHVIGTKVKFAN